MSGSWPSCKSSVGCWLAAGHADWETSDERWPRNRSCRLNAESSERFKLCNDIPFNVDDAALLVKYADAFLLAGRRSMFSISDSRLELFNMTQFHKWEATSSCWRRSASTQDTVNSSRPYLADESSEWLAISLFLDKNDLSSISWPKCLANASSACLKSDRSTPSPSDLNIPLSTWLYDSATTGWPQFVTRNVAQFFTWLESSPSNVFIKNMYRTNKIAKRTGINFATRPGFCMLKGLCFE